jgi:hypothetical protein
MCLADSNFSFALGEAPLVRGHNFSEVQNGFKN